MRYDTNVYLIYLKKSYKQTHKWNFQRVEDSPFQGESWKVLKYYPCLTKFLISLKNIKKKWLTPPDSGDNRWEFKAIFYNPNINFKKLSKGRKYIIPEDFGFKPDSFILSLKLTDICHKGELETDKERLKKVFGPLNGERWLSINQLRSHIKTLPINSKKIPSLPLQEIPKEGFYFEELSDLFYVSKRKRLRIATVAFFN